MKNVLVLPHEIGYQFGGRNVRSSHERSVKLEQFWNEKSVGKLTNQKNDVFCLEDECDAYAYAVQFCPQEVKAHRSLDKIKLPKMKPIPNDSVSSLVFRMVKQ